MKFKIGEFLRIFVNPDSIEEQQKEKMNMKSTLIASIPALIVLFALAFGFVTFHLMAQNAEATGAACTYLAYNCGQESEHANDACRSSNAERCRNAKSDAMQVCSEYYNTCQ